MREITKEEFEKRKLEEKLAQENKLNENVVMDNKETKCHYKWLPATAC